MTEGGCGLLPDIKVPESTKEKDPIKLHARLAES